MALFYLDVEAEGEDPQQDRLVTVQYQALSDDLKPAGDFSVLAEWEWGEKEIVRTVLGTGILEPTWDFVPVGNRLRFDLTFLMERAHHHGLRTLDAAELRRFWFEKPMLDLGNVLVLMNGGKFDGSSLGSFVDKRPSGDVPILYRQGKYEEILEYVQKERDVTLGLAAELRSMLATFGERKRHRAP